MGSAVCRPSASTRPATSSTPIASWRAPLATAPAAPPRGAPGCRARRTATSATCGNVIRSNRAKACSGRGWVRSITKQPQSTRSPAACTSPRTTRSDGCTGSIRLCPATCRQARSSQRPGTAPPSRGSRHLPPSPTGSSPPPVSTAVRASTWATASCTSPPRATSGSGSTCLPRACCRCCTTASPLRARSTPSTTSPSTHRRATCTSPRTAATSSSASSVMSLGSARWPDSAGSPATRAPRSPGRRSARMALVCTSRVSVEPTASVGSRSRSPGRSGPATHRPRRPPWCSTPTPTRSCVAGRSPQRPTGRPRCCRCATTPTPSSSASRTCRCRWAACPSGT